MIAETAQLLVELNLAGNFNSGIAQAETRLGTFGGAVTSGFSKVESAAGRVGGALSHAGSQIKGLITGPLGMIGLAGALFSVGGAIESGIGKAEALGDETRRLSALTGLSAESMSILAGQLEHFGVGADSATRLVGFLEKNVGLLAAKKDGIVNFQKQFGLQLLDTNGKVKDANALILTTVDYFNNKSIPATEKAAALSKLFGRSWQELIPFMQAGRQGLSDVAVELQKYGLALTGDNVKKLNDFKTAQRDFGTALSGLELQIGLKLIPKLKDLADTATAFIGAHGAEITDFFDQVTTFAGNAAGTIGSVAGSIVSFWNGIPKPFRDLITTGLVADRTIKFLFGFDPIKFVVSGIESGLAKVLGQGVSKGLVSAGLGKLFVQPVFVTNMGAGGLGGAAGAAEGAAEGAGGVGIIEAITGSTGLLATLMTIAAPLAVGATAAIVARDSANSIGGIADILSKAPGDTRGKIDSGRASLNNSILLPPFVKDILNHQLDILERIAPSNNKPGSPDDRDQPRLLAAAIDKAQSKFGARIEQILPAKIESGIHKAVVAADLLRSKAYAQYLDHSTAQLSAKIEDAGRIAAVASRLTAGRVDSESAAVTRAIHAQKLAVHIALTNKTTVSVTDINGAIRSHAIYSTGMRGAELGM